MESIPPKKEKKKQKSSDENKKEDEKEKKSDKNKKEDEKEKKSDANKKEDEKAKKPESKKKPIIKFADKKEFDKEADKDIIDGIIKLTTNLKKLKLNEKAIEGIYLYGCDILQVEPLSDEFNKVNIMRKARKIKAFQNEVNKHVPGYYISGLVLMGKPKNKKEDKKFKFYLNMFQYEDRHIEGEVRNEKGLLKQNDDRITETIYEFVFKRKFSLSAQQKGEEDTEISDNQCLSNYLNICLGKLLKQCGYTKDRTSRKILYYNKEETYGYEIGNGLLYYPALKAVCETFDGGIFLKLLPRRMLKTSQTYEDFFFNLKKKERNFNFETFIDKIRFRKGLKTYNQEIIKIEDAILENHIR